MLDLDPASWASRGEHHRITLAVFILLPAAHGLPSPEAQQNGSGINESPPDGRHLASPRILPRLQNREKSDLSYHLRQSSLSQGGSDNSRPHVTI